MARAEGQVKPLKVQPGKVWLTASRSDLAEMQREYTSINRYWRINNPKIKVDQEVQFEIRKLGFETGSAVTLIKVNRGKPVKQVVAPKCLRRQVMDLTQDSIMGGHLGVRKTADI